MTPYHDTGTKIQVYLRPAERNRLDRLTAALDASKSGVVRRGLEALERQLADPHQHPALGIVGIVPPGAASPADHGSDVARNHDDCLVGDEIASWSKRRRSRGGAHDSE